MPPAPTRRPATRCGEPISPARDASDPASSGAPCGTGPAGAGDSGPCRRRAARRRHRTCDRCPARAKLRQESLRQTSGRTSARAIVPAKRANRRSILKPHSWASVRRDLHADEAKMSKGPVSCRFCKHENPAGARFCNDCGAPLAAPTITREPRSYTPRHLVEKILASHSALRGERKLVTVLFADVVRSMELAERVDPEEWHRLLDRLFRILAGGVHRYEGTINQYTGDGIMALFGAPIAHEDHAQRACAAALDLARELGALAEDVRRESGLEFAVRMGLNSGEVVVGRIGDDLRMDYTAQGHVVGLAARVQQLAPPGGITLTEQTARLAAGFFDFLDRGEQSLKGASAPVRVFELRGPGQIRSRLESSPARGFSRFVGRERELALLERALRETQSGRRKVVLVTAEPGAGKSRLCHEFVERARGVALHYARALSHGRTLPFHVIVALARSLFGVGEGAPPSEVRNAVRRGLGNAQPDPIALEFWLDLLGVSDHVPAASGLDPEARR